MKKTNYITAAVLSLCLLCGCSEKAVTAGVTEQSETEASVTTSEAVTESTTSEAVTEKPAEAEAYREDNEIKADYSDDNILYYASHGMLNEGCKINGIEAEFEWEGSPDKEYAVKIYDENYDLFLEQTVEGN